MFSGSDAVVDRRFSEDGFAGFYFERRQRPGVEHDAGARKIGLSSYVEPPGGYRAVGIFPNEASITRLIGAVLFEQNDEWRTQNRYMMVEAFDRIDAAEPDLIPARRASARRRRPM